MAEPVARTRDLLSHPALRALLLAGLVDGVGTWAFNTVFAVVVFDRTHSVSAITVALACRWIPALIIGPFAGVLADRYDRGRIMIGSALVSAALMGLLAAGVAGGVALPVLLTVSGVQALAAAVFNPALGAALPDTVPENLLAGANGLREVAANAAVLVGPAVGSVFLIAGTPALGVAFNAATYLVPAVVIFRLRIRSRGAGSSGANPLAEVRDGITALRSQRTAVVLLIAVALDSAIASTSVALALPISDYVGSGSTHYGYLIIGSSLGSILAAGLSSRLAARPHLAAVITGSLMLQTVPLALIVAFPSVAGAFVLYLVSGAGMIVVDIVTVTALQRDVPAQYLGRVFGLLDTTLLLFVTVFANVGGLLVGWFGLATTLLVLGLGTPLVIVAGLPVLRETDRRTAARAHDIEPVVELLERLDLFDGADRPMLERVAFAAQHEQLPADHVLLREGEAADDVWLLAEGRLTVTARSAGDLPDVTAPGYVGEIGVVHRRPRSATVTTATGCLLYRIAGADFLDALANRSASPALLLVTGERLSRTDRSFARAGE